MRFHHLSGQFQFEQGTLVKIDDTPSTATQNIDDTTLRTIMLTLPPTDRRVLRAENMQLTRASIRASIGFDLLITNTINNIEEIDKIANTLTKRLREWYAIYDPELEHRLKDHRVFVDEVLANKQRSTITMGGTIDEQDLIIMHAQAARIRDLFEQRDRLVEYLETVMQEHTPNLRKVAGATIGAKLLALAGSMQRLASMPSGTIQLLGAETALFRHLRNPRARPPKHGILFNHILLQRAPKDLRGRAARALADKITIAAKIDYFHGEYRGDTLLAEAERKIADGAKTKKKPVSMNTNDEHNLPGNGNNNIANNNGSKNPFVHNNKNHKSNAQDDRKNTQYKKPFVPFNKHKQQKRAESHSSKRGPSR